MSIPSHLCLSADDLRYVRHCQLEALTGISATNFPRWDQGHAFSERTLTRIAQSLQIDKSVVLHGFELRRQDLQTARNAQAKARDLIHWMAIQKSA